jgi:hypothetical protein
MSAERGGQVVGNSRTQRTVVKGGFLFTSLAGGGWRGSGTIACLRPVKFEKKKKFRARFIKVNSVAAKLCDVRRQLLNCATVKFGSGYFLFLFVSSHQIYEKTPQKTHISLTTTWRVLPKVYKIQSLENFVFYQSRKKPVTDAKSRSAEYHIHFTTPATIRLISKTVFDL